MTDRDFGSDSQFLDKLEYLFDDNKQKGTVWLQIKRFEEKDKASGKKTPQCLIRANSNKKKSKVSRAVGPNKIRIYQQGLSKVLKKNVDKLNKPADYYEKKKEERKEKEAAAKAAKAAKAEAEEAAKKAEEEKKKAEEAKKSSGGGGNNNKKKKKK